MARPARHCHLLRHLEAESEVRRRSREHLLPCVRCRELIETEVTAHRGERLGVLANALSLELLSGELLAGEVAIGGVDASEPSFVLPGRRAEVDAALG